MWTLITNKEQIHKIKVSDFLLRYQNDDSDENATPTGDELNSHKYQVAVKYMDSFELEGALSKTQVAGMTVVSMKRQVDADKLLDGTWWIMQ